jgi:hypothetical protein
LDIFSEITKWIQSFYFALNIHLKNGIPFKCAVNPFLFRSTIDTVYHSADITTERMSEFQFTNAYLSSRYVALYAQHSDATTFNFTGISAGISMNVYIIMLFSWCALLLLFALIEYSRPSSEKKTFNWWNIGMAIMPFTQAPSLEHSQSISRCVAIITANVFVLLCATYYQMLLLSNCVVKHSRKLIKIRFSAPSTNPGFTPNGIRRLYVQQLYAYRTPTAM